MTAPRIALVLPYGIVGGAESWALRVLDAWPSEVRDRVFAVALGDGPVAARFRDRGLPVDVMSVGPRPVDLVRAVPRLRTRVAGADVVWANGLKSAAVAAPGRALGGPPVVWVKHDRSYDASLARPLGRVVRRVVAVSSVIAAPVGRDDVVVVPPPLPADDPADRDTARVALLAHAPSSWSDVPFLAVTVGRLSGYKHVGTAVRSLVHAPSWHLLVVGDDDPNDPGESERLRALAEASGVAARVHLAGGVPGVGRLLGGADAVLVLTGFDAEGYGGEGWSTVALEAMWAGAPLVGTPDGAPMAADSAGVVPVGSGSAVATTLRALEDEGERRLAVERGRHALSDHPDADAVAARLLTTLAAAAR